MDSITLARRARLSSLEMIAAKQCPHIGSVFSMLDILAVLYTDVLRVDSRKPEWSARDRFILSKGHAAAGLYAVLAELEFFPKSWLAEFSSLGSPLTGHVNHRGVPGVDFSTGSLGHGVSVAAGMALALPNSRAFALVSDGECNEGALWEAALFAAHHRIENLGVIVDANGWQGLGRTDEVLRLSPLREKWQAFGWEVRECDGHDHGAIRAALIEPPRQKPWCLLAKTVKGKGISFMEDELVWHYRSPNAAECEQGRGELENP